MIHSCPSRARANRLRISAEPIRYHSLHRCAPATRSRTAAPELRPSIVAYRSRLIRRGIRRCSARDNGAERPATHDLVFVHRRHMLEKGLFGALLDDDTATWQVTPGTRNGSHSGPTVVFVDGTMIQPALGIPKYRARNALPSQFGFRRYCAEVTPAFVPTRVGAISGRCPSGSLPKSDDILGLMISSGSTIRAPWLIISAQ